MAEAVSFLLLLGVAMPLKYVAGQPMAVKIVGWIHGLLFVLFCTALYQAMMKHEWPIKKAATFFVAALLPFGPFLVDGKLKAEEQAPAQE